MKRTQTAEEKRHLSKLAGMGCVVCELYGYMDTPSVIHHVRVNHGWGRSGHLNTLPLCYEHHVGKTGVHGMGRNEFKEMHGYTEIELLEMLKERMSEN